MARPPDAEVEISITLVRQLLTDEDEALAALPLTHVGNGWDNEVFRLGDELAVRLPRRASAAPLIVSEQRWLPEIAERFVVPIPAPIVSGRPSHGYPWHWSVVPWIPGNPIAQAGAISDDLIARLAQFLVELHQPAPSDAPANSVRGIPLRDRSESTLRYLDELRLPRTDDARIRRMWAEACLVPYWPNEPLWLHGDLHPLNILEMNGQLTGVIDFGDVTAGDPATDLALAWMLPGDGHPHALQSALGDTVGPDTWARARGWALSLGVTFSHFGDSDSGLREIGERTLARVLHITT
jgi:aminoglycoside phosphotransferase (APT) family kinase protein